MKLHAFVQYRQFIKTFFSLIVRITFALSLLFSSIAFAQEGTQKSDQSNIDFQFLVDGQSWEPGVDLLRELTTTPMEDVSQILIQLLYARANLNNIVIEKFTVEKRILFKISARRYPRIGEVSFRGITSAQVQQARANIRTRVGVPFVAEESERDRESIRLKMVERGYLKAVVGSPEVSMGVSGELKVGFPVSLNTPCRIAEIQTEPDESLFDYFSTPIELGALCDKASINEILERQRARLLTDGYLNSELFLNQLNFSEDKERGAVKIRYVRGPKTRLEVVNRQTGIVSDVLSEFRENISAYDVLSLSDDDLRSEVRKVFVRLGFASAVVTGPSRLTDANGDSVVRFYLQNGPLVVISETQFVGEIPLPKQEILERMELVPGLFQGAVPFVEDSLARYRDRLLSIYLDEGYADARVVDPVFVFAADGRSVKLIFETKPGARSVLRDVTILGRPFDFSLTKNFEDKILQPGQPVNGARLKALEEEVRLELMNAGYAYARIQVSTKSLPVVGGVKPVQVSVDLDPGPLVRIGKIYAEGDVFGKQDRIVQESGIRNGDLFTPDALEMARMSLLKHDLFESILVEPLSAESVERKDAILDIVIRAQAKRSYTLGLSPSYGTRNGYRFTIDYAKNNLTKDGLRFTSTLSVSQEKLQSSVLSNQRILGRKLTLGVAEPMFRLGDSVFPFDWNALSGVEVSAQSLSDRYFETFETGIAWRPRFANTTWALQAKFSHEWSKSIGQSSQPLEALERPTIKIHELVLGVSLDTRNNPEWPTSGLTMDVGSNHARFGLLSDVQYDRYSVDLGFFFPLWRRLSGAVNAGGLKISDVVNSKQKALTAPSSRRATLAGRSLVRGFPEASSTVTPGPLLWLNFQAPEQNLNLNCQPTLRSIGSTNVLYAKSELRVRSPWFGESLGFAGFFDTGAAFFTANELQSLQSNLAGGDAGLDPGSQDTCALKSAKVVGDAPIKVDGLSVIDRYFDNSYISTGLGIRYIISTFASLNLDVGIPLREPGEKSRSIECIDPSVVGASKEAPVCVKRRSSSKLFGLFPVPGAYHIGIGANF